MKKILFIASADLTQKSGGSYANLAFYQALTNTFHGFVDLIPFSNSLPEDTAPDYYAPPKSLFHKILDMPQGVIHRYDKWIDSFLPKYGVNYNCCIINDGLKGDIISKIKNYIPYVVVIHHNCEVIFQNDNNRPTTLWGIFPYWVKRNECLSYKLSDLNLFLTAYDKELFQSKYGSIPEEKSKVVGMFLPIEEEPNEIISAGKHNVMAISGGLNNVQTIIGIKDFLKYYRLIQERFEDKFRIIISGRNPSAFINSLPKKYKHIEIFPNPLDINDVISQAGIFVCPVNVGSGIKLRIMDGLKLGMPILTHEVSARGYEMFFDKPWFQVYNDINSFRNGLAIISEIVEFDKDNMRKDIIQCFNQYYSFKNGSERFIKLISKFVC